MQHFLSLFPYSVVSWAFVFAEGLAEYAVEGV